ncbi:MAG: hypothetical protein WKF95_08465, partial [Rubrobacter sp.]
REDGLTLQEVLDLDYERFMESLGRDVIGSRTRNATLGLSTIKSAARKYLTDHARGTPDRTGESTA